MGFTKKQFDSMVATSGTFKEIDDAIEFLELKIELLERTEKNLSQWTYDIKNAVEIIKMETT
jgi:chaperonin cofactor prefoldin